MNNLRPGWALWFGLISSVALFGCGKSEKSPAPAALPVPVAESTTGSAPGQSALPTDSQPGTESAAPEATPVQVNPVIIGDGADLNEILAQLTQAVRKYSFEKRRMPKTLEEVIAAGYVSAMPNPPAGKKFTLEPKNVEVILTKR